MAQKKKKIERLFPVPRDKQKESYWKLLNNVIDPEVGVGIVDLGLIYDVAIQAKDRSAVVTMTLTSMGCPAGPEIMRRIEAEMGRYPNVEDVKINLVWDPVWGPDRISEDVRGLLLY